MKIDIDKLKSSDNIVDLIKENKNESATLLYTIGSQVAEGYKIDEDSRSGWRRTIDRVMKLITTDPNDTKTFPWPGAANVKYPLIKAAAVDYSARTLPEIIQNDRIIKCAITGDETDTTLKRCNNVTEFMTYQLLREDSDWEDGLDKLLQLLPILGTVFKKTYYSLTEKKNKSELCVPDKIVVNYNTQTLETARRITHVLTMYQNDIVERQRLGIFDDTIDVTKLCNYDTTVTLKDTKAQPDPRDDDSPLTILEQHFWYDLDGDGYKEPYIAFVHAESQTVLRIVNRFKDIQKNSKGQIMKIEPIHYFTDFHFIRSNDGGFYSEGFGSLLLPINATINTLFNQLLDAGTLNTSPSGFITRAFRTKSGEFAFRPGEWKVLESFTGGDLSKALLPLPTKEPSPTLYNALLMLIQAGKDLAQSTDATKGTQPGQNVANGVMNSLIEQSTKLDTAINKRVYRGLKKEFLKLYELNAQHINPAQYRNVLNQPDADYKKDFNLGDLDIYPVADPTVSSTSQRMIKAQVLMSLRTADPRAIDEFILQSIQLDDKQIAKILPPPPENAPPPLEAQKTMSEIQLNSAKSQQIQMEMMSAADKSNLDAKGLEIKKQDSNTRAMESQARIAKMGGDHALGQGKISIAARKMQQQEDLNRANFEHQRALDEASTIIAAASEENKRRKTELDAQLKAAALAKDSTAKNEETE